VRAGARAGLARALRRSAAGARAAPSRRLVPGGAARTREALGTDLQGVLRPPGARRNCCAALLPDQCRTRLDAMQVAAQGACGSRVHWASPHRRVQHWWALTLTLAALLS